MGNPPGVTMTQSQQASLWWLWDALWPLLKAVGPILESNFSTSLFGALCGAWAGAYAAQKIAERKKRIDDAVLEIRNANAAIIISHMICNQFIELKRQHVLEMQENYNAQEIAYAEHVRTRNAAPFQVNADFETVPVPLVATPALEDVAYNRLSLRNRALMLVPHLVQIVEHARGAYGDRIRVIEEFRTRRLPAADFAHAYLGIPTAAGVTDARYRSSITAIVLYTNDVIYFSKMLSEDIAAHAERVRMTLRKKAQKNAPHVNSVSYSDVPDGLVPDAAEYETWNRQPR
jgi:hypothetical protein